MTLAMDIRLASEKALEWVYTAHKIVDSRSPVAVALTRQMLYRNAAQSHPVEARSWRSGPRTSAAGRVPICHSFIRSGPAGRNDRVEWENCR